MATLYFEDLTIGRAGSIGGYEVTAGEIIEFAGRWDPAIGSTPEDGPPGKRS